MKQLFAEGTTFGAYSFILVGFALLGFSHAQAAGAVNSSFARQFRYSGAVLTSDFGWLIGAAFAPLVALLLASHLGVGYVGLYLLSGAIATLAALRINRSLEMRSEEHTSELQSLMRISYDVFCLKKKNKKHKKRRRTRLKHKSYEATRKH